MATDDGPDTRGEPPPSERGPAPDAAMWERIEEICFEAMRRPPAERERYVAERCGSDTDLRRQVETLVDAWVTRPDFLEAPLLVLSDDPDLESGRLGVWAPPAEDEHIGPYRIVRPLGHGGMGDVWLARLEGEGFDRFVAIKVIRRGLDTARVLQRFHLERKILAGLRHANIAALVDGGRTDDGRPYLVMQYVEGEPLDRYCSDRGLSVTERVRLIRSVCSAVQHAHQNLVVHRDIKPGNVLVDTEGIPVLLDFGVSSLLAEHPDTDDPHPPTRLEERAFTPEYASPEQAAGERVTTATDVYQLGLLLKRITADAESVRGEPARGELARIVEKATRADPEERYVSPAALSEDLERWLEGRPIVARPPSLGYVAMRFAGRHRWGVAAAGIVAATLLVAAAYGWSQSQRVAAERDRALEVRGFLLETFGAAGADRATGDSVTARALLDGQASTVEAAYADDPALLAEMMTVLAEGYDRLGLLDDAAGWAERVVALGASSDGPGNAQGIALLGWIRHQQGRSIEARDLLGDAVRIARDGPGAERTLVRALNDLGVVQEALGEYDAAEAAYREALDLQRDLYGPGHRAVGITGSNLSAIHYRKGDLDGAVREATRALAILTDALGPDHQRSIIVLSNLAVFKLVEGDLDGAAEDYRDLWARQVRVQGPDHPVTIRVMASLATVLRRQERWAEAEAVLLESVTRLERQEAPNAADLGASLATLGEVVSAQGRFTEGLTSLGRALDLQEPLLGPDHVDVAQTYAYLSHAYERVDSLDRALEWQERVVGSLGAALGAEHDQTRAERERLIRLRSQAAGSAGGV